MAGGSFYIYKKFYTPEEHPMSSSSYVASGSARNNYSNNNNSNNNKGYGYGHGHSTSGASPVPPLPPAKVVKTRRVRRSSMDDDDGLSDVDDDFNNNHMRDRDHAVQQQTRPNEHGLRFDHSHDN
ncbi:hypothetical protein BGZ94_008371 [Podila epigama]|nr:hypothetical protein BGZ94_008371 [Podila epigama]